MKRLIILVILLAGCGKRGNIYIRCLDVDRAKNNDFSEVFLAEIYLDYGSKVSSMACKPTYPDAGRTVQCTCSYSEKD